MLGTSKYPVRYTCLFTKKQRAKLQAEADRRECDAIDVIRGWIMTLPDVKAEVIAEQEK